MQVGLVGGLFSMSLTLHPFVMAFGYLLYLLWPFQEKLGLEFKGLTSNQKYVYS